MTLTAATTEYSVEVEFVEPVGGADARAPGQRESVAMWYPADVGQPVLLAFEAERGWAFPVDDGFTTVACSIERPWPDGSVVTTITCENPVAVALDVALGAMALPQAECQAALPTEEDLAPCENDGCSVGAPRGNPLPHLALLSILAVALAERRRRR